MIFTASIWKLLDQPMYLYQRIARLLRLLQLAASGALSKLSAEHAHCLFIVAGEANRHKHVNE